MSEQNTNGEPEVQAEAGQGAAPDTTPGQDAGGAGVAGAPRTGPNGGYLPMNTTLLQLWITWGGRLISVLGLLNIILSWKIHLNYDTPLLLMIGMMLMGASYVLAGKGLSESNAWPLPLVILCCVTSMYYTFGVSLLGLIFLAVICDDAKRRGALREDPTQDADVAFGLCVGGVFLIILQGVLSL